MAHSSGASGPGVHVLRAGNPAVAAGAALPFLAARPPFADFPARVLVGSVHGQIARGHYWLAHRDDRMCGYIGWAMLDADVARRVRRGGTEPTPEECAHGRDVVWILMLAATDRVPLLACVNAVRRDHPGLRLMGMRHRAGRGFVFDQPIRPRRAEAGVAPPGRP